MGKGSVGIPAFAWMTALTDDGITCAAAAL